MAALRKLSRSILLFSIFAVLLALGGCGGGGDGWRAEEYQGVVLLSRPGESPGTEVVSPDLIASGKVTDQSVISAVEEISGQTEAQTVELLRSFDTDGTLTASVITLTHDMYVTRYWSDPNSKLGRWFTTSERDFIYSPDEAIRYFALPASNQALDVTLYKIKAGAKLIFGYCSDMRWNPSFSTRATGGGVQYWIPKATIFQNGEVLPNPDVLEIVEELREVEGQQAA